MRPAAFALCGLFIAGPAGATQDAFPALYDVRDVAADDVLNIRAAPSSDSATIGALAPDARDIEVLVPGPRGRWARINHGEGTGWVSLRYLERHPGQWFGAVPQVARCFGTEPFWSLTRDGDGFTLTGVDRPAQAMTPLWQGSAASRRDRHAIRFDGGSAVITYAACSDGMSDRQFGLTIDLILTGAETEYRTGCCTLQP